MIQLLLVWLINAFALVVPIALGAAHAQTFPVKPLRVINPAAPGGNSDIFFRILSPKMSEILGQSVIIDYRPGAGGTIGADMTAKSPPDGYTTALVAALVLGLINAVIRPVLVLLTLPVTLLTLGLFIFVLNGLLFWFVGSFIQGFVVAGFWAGVFGAIVFSLISWLLSALLLRSAAPRTR